MIASGAGRTHAPARGLKLADQELDRAIQEVAATRGRVD